MGRARAFFVFMLGVGTLAAFGLIVLLPLADRLLDPSYDRALDIVPWLVLLVPLTATRSIPLNALLGLGRADVRMMIYIAAGLVTLVCYLALIPSMSWRGAVIATFVGESFLACTGWLALKRIQGDADRRRSSAETNAA
jgi:O-antigen/teichoic acid export membrane protein